MNYFRVYRMFTVVDVQLCGLGHFPYVLCRIGPSTAKMKSFIVLICFSTVLSVSSYYTVSEALFSPLKWRPIKDLCAGWVLHGIVRMLILVYALSAQCMVSGGPDLPSVEASTMQYCAGWALPALYIIYTYVGLYLCCAKWPCSTSVSIGLYLYCFCANGIHWTALQSGGLYLYSVRGALDCS